MRFPRIIAGWLVALLVFLWRATCRYKIFHDPRPALREKGDCYVYALLHAHQLAAVLLSDEKVRAMVSRSADGDLLAPSLKMRRLTPVRGSTRKHGKDKGGQEALAVIRAGVEQGVPGLFAVDGPRGPRNHVHIGVCRVAADTGVPVLTAMVLPSRRWILGKTWDRFQIPKPFCRVRLIFGKPIYVEGRDVEVVRSSVEEALRELEQLHDPGEAESSSKLTG